MRTNSGWANWRKFRSVFVPVIQAFIDQYCYTPRSRELAACGHQKLVSATFHHYHGYLRALRLCGFPPPPRNHRPRKKPRPVRTGGSRWGIWNDDQRCKETLVRCYSTYTSWQVMPPTTALKHQHRGLMANVMRRYKTWEGAAIALGFLPWAPTRRYRRQALCIIEAWGLQRQLGRWPIARECSSALRKIRYNRTGLNWETALCIPLPAPIQKRLMITGYQHLLWLRKHRPEVATRHEQLLRSLRPTGLDASDHSSA